MKGKLLEVRSVNQVFIFVNNQHVGTLAEDLWSGRDYLAMLSRSLNAVGVELEITKMHAVDFYNLITPGVSASVAPYLARRDGVTKKAGVSRTEVALNMKATDIESI